jgi:hypothetical protein
MYFMAFGLVGQCADFRTLPDLLPTQPTYGEEEPNEEHSGISELN